MKFTALIAVAAFVLPTLAQDYTYSYDTRYDNSGLSLNDVACSDGANGLAAKYPTLGQLPTFPKVGGVVAITGWNSPNCGSCWEVTYGNQTIYFTGVDVSQNGFVSSEAAMNTLTGNQAVDLGRINVTAVQVAASSCGL
ncbi:Asp f 13-like protein [Hygrophoropsis aurantiaca]|uniref:Asp f 13-like protein n=1 Tax=Hygrophoropsis aurantiaca TaxID=72124 RepID=A0ACB8AFH9_9AGAM|nr:Asp f 13-like protein [Hygrophoropsis aurantiaca]